MHLLRAAQAPRAVIFRRGPSKRVEVVAWDSDRDEFTRGHWFHGRIYERRSDLSPDGALLVYFASKFTAQSVTDREYTYAWTAVSKPPWLSALALWPKGDCWWGGGLFLGARRLLLNHRPAEATPHPKHPPTGLTVDPNPEARGENDPLYAQRLSRDGWALVQDWVTEWHGFDLGYRTVAPERRVRTHPDAPYRIVMERRLDNLRYSESFAVEGPDGLVELPAGHLDWVDWDNRGRLVVLSVGRVLAAEVTRTGIAPLACLVDLTGDTPEPRETPAVAAEW